MSRIALKCPDCGYSCDSQSYLHHVMDGCIEAAPLPPELKPIAMMPGIHVTPDSPKKIAEMAKWSAEARAAQRLRKPRLRK